MSEAAAQDPAARELRRRVCRVCGCSMERACVRQAAVDAYMAAAAKATAARERGDDDVRPPQLAVTDCCAWRPDDPTLCTACTPDGPLEGWSHPDPNEDASVAQEAAQA